MMNLTFSAVSCSNSRAILDGNLLLSPDIVSGRLPCRALTGTASAASAYAAIVSEKLADVLIFVHQDIYLPHGWLDQLQKAIAYLDAHDPAWAVIGSYGATSDGRHVGYLYDVSNARVGGHPVEQPTRVAILDEIVIVIKTASGVNFDPGLPGYHMYGTQIGIAAAERGKNVYVAHLPVVHNSQSIQTLDASFGQAWAYLSKHWAHRLPVPNLMCKIMDGTPWPLWRWRVHNQIQLLRGKRRLHSRIADVQALSRQIGFE